MQIDGCKMNNNILNIIVITLQQYYNSTITVTERIPDFFPIRYHNTSKL